MSTKIFQLKYLAPLSTIFATSFLIVFYNYNIDVDEHSYINDIPLVHKCWNQNLTFQFNSSKIYGIPSTDEEAAINYEAAFTTSFIIEEASFCKERPNLRVLAYVHSAISDVKERRITRSTWGNVSSRLDTLFFVGRARNKKEQKIVENESKIYGDIVQGNYTDEYKLLVYKSLNAFHWIIKNCGSVQWIIHADDDILLDANYLFKVLEDLKQNKRTNEIFCRIYINSAIQRQGKWEVDETEYPCKYFPPYCYGPFWFTSSSVIQKLLNSISRTKFLWVDDAYFTGVVADEANIKRSQVPVVFYDVNPNRTYCVLAWIDVEDRVKEWPKILNFDNDICSNNKNLI